jgi:hypothetical protein
MNQWSFVLLAYGIAGLATLLLVGWAYWVMRLAEKQAEAAKRRP